MAKSRIRDFSTEAYNMPLEPGFEALICKFVDQLIGAWATLMRMFVFSLSLASDTVPPISLLPFSLEES